MASRHFLDRQFRMGIDMWVQQVDGLFASQQVGEPQCVESARRGITMAE
jgi:hypothetical protein